MLQFFNKIDADKGLFAVHPDLNAGPNYCEDKSVLTDD